MIGGWRIFDAGKPRKLTAASPLSHCIPLHPSIAPRIQFGGMGMAYGIWPFEQKTPTDAIPSQISPSLCPLRARHPLAPSSSSFLRAQTTRTARNPQICLPAPFPIRRFACLPACLPTCYCIVCPSSKHVLAPLASYITNLNPFTSYLPSVLPQRRCSPHVIPSII